MGGREGGEMGGKRRSCNGINVMTETVLSHDKPDSMTKHNAYLIPSDEIPYIM